VADAWAAADGARRDELLEQGELVLLTTGGGFPLYVALLLGLPFLLFGLAVVFADNHPSGLGWLGAVAGAGAFVVGTANFAGLEFPPIELFVIFVFLLDIWMLVIGTLMCFQERHRVGGEVLDGVAAGRTLGVPRWSTAWACWRGDSSGSRRL
jgi:hypothetical protein